MNYEAFFKQFLTAYSSNPEPTWNYEAGVGLMGARFLYEITGQQLYREAIIRYMDYFIMEDGTIRHLNTDELNLDKINSGRILYWLYDQTKEERYRKAIEILADMLRCHPRTNSKNFWHKQIYPHQVWLDGLYMGLPFLMEYETRFNNKENYNDIFSQMIIVREKMYDDKTHLYYHAWDESKSMPWADKQTGLSHNFWLRSVGWHLMALIDLYELCSQEVFEQQKKYAEWFKEALRGVLEYRDEATGLFYQLIALPTVEGNYIETSGSAMVAYAVLKGCRLGVLNSEKYLPIGNEMIQSLHDTKLVEKDGIFHLNDMCLVAGLGPGNERDGSVEYYLSEPIVSDEVKGVGATMMAYSEWLKLQKK